MADRASELTPLRKILDTPPPRDGSTSDDAYVLDDDPAPAPWSPPVKPWLGEHGEVTDEAAYYERCRMSGDMTAIEVVAADGECWWCHGARYVVKKRITADNHQQEIESCRRCLAQTKQRQWEALGIRAEIRFKDWQDVPELRAARSACDELIAGKRWCVLLSGPTGRGKTHLAKATLIDFVERSKGSAKFASVPALLDELRSCYDPAATYSLNSLMQFYEDRDLLVLDDLAAEKTTEWAAEKLFRIIDARYEGKRATLLTTNARPDSEAIPARVRSRLAEGAVVIAGGRDWRQP